MALTSYDEIRTAIVEHIIANLSWVSADNCFDFSPTDPATVFGVLPSVIVDFDRGASIEWEAVTQGYLRALPFLVEIYVEIPDSDTTGRTSSIDLAQKLREVEQLFEEDPSIGSVVKNSTIRSSKIESLRIDAIQLGVMVRFAWVALVVYALT